MRAPVLTALASALLASVIGCIGCAIGAEQEPGCHADADCGDGWVCAAGACFQSTTGQSSPAVDGGDAGEDGEPGDADSPG
jgi:hypothetical protein